MLNCEVVVRGPICSCAIRRINMLMTDVKRVAVRRPAGPKGNHCQNTATSCQHRKVVDVLLNY